MAVVLPRPRLIPARAGNIGRHTTASPRTPAHPRSRGEHRLAKDENGQYFGSSPLARGTWWHLSSVKAPGRLIPARAGNMAWGGEGRGGSKAHPRSRGEHAVCDGFLAGIFGSSPLARGTYSPPQSQRITQRLIPARAGNIARRRVLVLRSSAHPRSRGEHETFKNELDISDGSSPLARGTSCPCVGVGFRGRLIPARAGNITMSKLNYHAQTAHPRSRGEHQRARVVGIASVGSSPLARGT